MFVKYLLPFFLVLILSCNSNQEIPSISIGNNVAVVTNGGENSIQVIDLSTLEVKNTIFLNSQSGTFVHHIYADQGFNQFALAVPFFDFSNGHSALHTSSPKGQIQLINANTGQLELNIEVPFANHNAVFSSDGSEVWTTTVSHSGKVYVYDVKSGKQLTEIPVGADPSEVIFAQNGQLALTVAEESSFLTIIDTKQKQIIKEVKVDPNPSIVWPGYDQNSVFVVNGNRKSLNVVDLIQQKVVDYIDFDFVPGFSIFNFDKKNVWVCNPAANKIMVYSKTDTWKVIKQINTDADPHQIKFFDSNNKAMVVNQKDNTAQIIDTNSFSILKTIQLGQKPNGILIKP